MNKRNGIGLAWLLVCAVVAAAPAGARPWIDMGMKDDVAFVQPVVSFELFRQLPNGGRGTSLGPEGDGFLFFPNEFILDTGATSIIAMNDAEASLQSNGYATVNVVEEQGVAGTQYVDVSDNYYIQVTDSNNVVNNLPNTRILSGQFEDLIGINGIVGMPGMVGKVVTLDNSHWTELDEIEDPLDFFSLLNLNVGLNNSLPASGGHRYSVPIWAKTFPLPDPGILPTAAPIPFVEMSVGADNLNASGSFILDTGAGMSFISTDMAIAIGLDSNGDGQLNSQDERFFDDVPVGGVGGTVSAPQFYIDRFSVTTEQGVDLVWNLDQALSVLIVDIHPDIDGVLGSDLLTSGWLQFSLDEGDLFDSHDGPLLKSHFDFRNFFNDGDLGKIYFDLTPSYDVVIADSLVGDYNGNGVVDAADYTVWRNSLGLTGTGLAADGDGSGTVDAADFNLWKSHFGETAGAGSGGAGASAIPEPNSLVLCLVVCSWAFGCRRRPLR